MPNQDPKPESSKDDIEAIRIEEVARLVGDYSPETIAAWERAGKFPRHFVATPGGPRLWLVKDIRAWIEQRKRARNTKPAPRGKLKQNMGGV